MDRRLIECGLPIRDIGSEATREKRIRKGHISTMFRWWARRPLASSRATNFAALVPKPHSKEDEDDLFQFIKELSRWENSTNQQILKKAQKLIKEFFEGRSPRVLDPFSGGGSIPLEALRLGCQTFASDYNPVAVFLLKCTLEYPQKYKHSLLEHLRRWGIFVLEQSRREMEQINKLPEEKNNDVKNDQKADIIGYLWSWFIQCPNPGCKIQIPLLKHHWIAKKKNKKIFLRPHITQRKIQFTIIEMENEKKQNSEKKAFNPDEGTVSRANVTCPSCHTIIPAKMVRQSFKNKEVHSSIITVVEKNKTTGKKVYRLPRKQDFQHYQLAEQKLHEKLNEFQHKHGFFPLPAEKLPPKDTLGFRVQRYGFLEWQDLFNARQKLTLIVIMDKILEAKKKLMSSSMDKELVKVIISYLSLLLADITRYNSILNRWVPESESLAEIFGRQAFSMIWNYLENNTMGNHGGTWERRLNTLVEALTHLITVEKPAAAITRASATNLPFKDSSFDAVFTDPPYYDNVPYSYLSDFFYVWLKRLVGDFYPDLFYSSTVPKKEDLVAYDHETTLRNAKKVFEQELTKAFKEIHRVLKPNGIAIILYAHKTTRGWEAVINALLQSGLTITAAWPIASEQKGRLRARSSAALSSTTYIIARKFQKKPLGIHSEIQQVLVQIFDEKMQSFWKENISGADFFIAVMGCGLEAYGMYEKVIDNKGRIITAEQILEDIRQVAVAHAISRLLKSKTTTKLSPLTQFYVMWRWCFQDKSVPFDEAKKLAQSTGVSLEHLWKQTEWIKKDKGNITILGPHERQKYKSNENTINLSLEPIELLHHLAMMWEEGNEEVLMKKLEQYQESKDELILLGQAIIEALDIGSKERKILEGLISLIKR